MVEGLEGEEVLDVEGLLTADFVPDDMRLELPTQQLATNKELKMQTINNILTHILFQKLFQQLITLMLIHLSGNIYLSGINVIFYQFCGELGYNLFRDTIVELLDFVELIHFIC